MKKFALLFCVCFVQLIAQAQYNNEWIDHSKTYYKIKIAADGLYRITPDILGQIGWSNQPAQDFQLWRNGRQVAIYSSISQGQLSATDYLEFWGEKNDGSLDRALYRTPNLQLSDEISLQTDTSVYFLTINNGTSNLRYATVANDVAGNTLAAEPYFFHTLRHNFTNRIHRGRAVPAGSEYLYSSSYDMGEMFSTNDIYASSPVSVGYNNLFVAANGPAAYFRASVAGSAPNNRSYKLEINNTVVKDTFVNGFNAVINVNPSVPLSVLSSNNANFRIVNSSTSITDRIVAGFVELTYPRQFNFANQSQFTFSLPASATGKYLEISNFNFGNRAPVLYDLTNHRRYVGNIAAAGLVRFVLPPSSATEFVLVSQEASNVRSFPVPERRNFINYSLSPNQGNYLIVTNPVLEVPYNGANQVELYRAYRASAAGGSYSAKTYNIDELVDQFAFGVKKHPLSIKNFLRFARDKFPVAPRACFIIGRGLAYDDYRTFSDYQQAERLNLVPTWGYPASDVLLGSNSLEPFIATPIGRIAVLNGQEVAIYLDKMKQYEQAQNNPVQTIESKGWMKNVVHVTGASDANLDLSLTGHLRTYETIIEDTLFGGNVVSFNKTSTGPVTPIVGSLMERTFEKGLSLLTYFGHSSASALDYNLNDPETYQNAGKYPLFLVLGCNAGNLYSFDTSRFVTLPTISEKFVLANNKGAIGFIASTHFGLEGFLDSYTRRFYQSIGVTSYGKSIGENMKEAIQLFIGSGYSFESYMHAEQTTLNGDPALKVNSFPKPDFAVEDQSVVINPTIVSVADNNFNVKVYFTNIGKATGDSVGVSVKRQSPNGQTEVLWSRNIESVRYMDSVSLTVPIIATRDKGENKIIVTIDSANHYAELSETNNSVTKSFIINEDEIRPIYPYNFSIVNTPVATFYASTANPVIPTSEYLLEVDTTELFNSSAKRMFQTAGPGGLIEFNVSNLTFKDSIVYYWRTAIAPKSGTNIIWNYSSFVYLPTGSTGFGQMHYDQYRKNGLQNLELATDRLLRYPSLPVDIDVSTGNFPPNDYPLTFVDVKNNRIANWGNNFGTVQIAVLNGKTLEPLENNVVGGASGSYGSNFPAGGRNRQFEYYFTTREGRRAAMNFLDSVPNGSYVFIWNLQWSTVNYGAYIDTWKSDTLAFGSGKSLYHTFRQFGLNKIDNFTATYPFLFVFRKNDASFAPIQQVGNTAEVLTTTFKADAFQVEGLLETPLFGPVKKWNNLQWKTQTIDGVAGDSTAIQVYGSNGSGAETLLATVHHSSDTSIGFINAQTYPYLRLKLANKDKVFATPAQLQYLLLKADPVPEGGLAPNILFTMKDTVDMGEAIRFSIAFKNISRVAFDSLALKMIITDRNNVPQTISLPKKKPLVSGDTILVSYTIPSQNFAGNNTLFLEVNPGNAQPEQHHFNNFLYHNFFVKSDTYQPLMDVTFDGVYILNGDIVSAQPNILIRLKDESKFLALDDTSLTTVFVRYPGSNGTLRRFAFGTDTLRLIPADLSTGKNEAMIEFNPVFLEDSNDDFYELVVRAKDKSGNPAGITEYKVRFQVYTKPMISNLFNYPNPFTTSTAFVFTITGGELPQNMRIQIMTVTGKIVKEITMAELGPIHIGRNITEYKWDGTDQFGQKLANGVYLYRVITSHNGSALEKFNITDQSGDRINTDKYFNKGYGKMYLMR